MPTRNGTPADDTYYVTSSDDQIIEAANSGSDTIQTTVNYKIAPNSHVERLVAAAPAGADPLQLTGNEWNQVIVGNAGANLINGGGGYDVLTGGGGADRFIASGNVATITDFDPADDRIVFTSLFSALPNGPLPASAFVVGPAPTDPNHRIIYDIQTGRLFYDADGNQPGGAAHFATIAAGLTTLTAANFERNPAPVVASDSATMDLRTQTRTASGNVLANDSDPQGEPLELFAVSKTPGPDYGTLVWQPNGTYTFTAADNAVVRNLRPGQVGTVSYSTSVIDAVGNVSVTALTIRVVGVNDAPDAADDLVVTTEAAVLSGFGSGVRGNDSDPDGDATRVTEVNGTVVPASGNVVLQGRYGTLSIDATGFYTYTMTDRAALSDGQVGQEVFDYTLTDSSGAADTARLTLEIYGSSGPETQVGGETTVNTNVAGDQTAPSVTALANGGFVVVWQSAENGGDIKAQLFGADGQKSGAEFLVNANVAGVQLSPAVTALDTGGFAVAWHSDQDVKSQAFDLLGNKIGQEFTLDLPAGNPSSDQFLLGTEVEVADLTGAGYVIGFVARHPGGSGRSSVQIVEDSGVARGAAIEVATRFGNSSVDVVGLSNGSFAVAYDYVASISRGISYTDLQIRGPNGELVRPSYNTFLGPQSDLAARPGGGFVLAALEDTGSLISAVVIDNAGNGVVGGTTVTGSAPAVAAFEGGHLVTFNKNGDIGAQLFNSSGALVRDWFTVNSVKVGEQSASSVTFLANGRAVIVWQDGSGSDGSGSGIKMQLLELSFAPATGTPDADRFLGTEAADEIHGNAGNDEILGRGGNDILFGDDGDDLLRGEGGNDYLEGGTGNDRLFGGLGADLLTGGADNDFLEGQEDNDEIYGGEGDDYVDGGLANDRVYGGGGTDVVVGGFGSDQLYGEAGDDQLYAGDHDDYADGGDGSDRVYGGFGYDLLIGGLGNDQLYGQQDADRLFGGDGDDYLDGGDGFDTLNAGIGADVAVGGAGNDTILGEDGDDELQGQDGNDYLNGGTGNDRLLGGAGVDVIVAGLGDDILLGENDDDELHGQDGNDYLVGGSGNDRQFGGLGADTLLGGLGNDLLEGAEGDDLLLGQDDNDLLAGGSGQDVLSGGEGADRLAGGADGDQLYGDNGDDQLLGEGGDDFGDGGAGADFMVGGDGRDRFYGGLGTDLVLGGTGDDELYGQDDVDELRGEDGNDYLDGGSGADRLYGEAGADVLAGGANGDQLYGGDDRDELYGNDGNDYLDGGTGGDILLGGAGDDILIGGTGADSLFGQDGADIFIMTNLNGAADGDRLLDFSTAAGDKIDLGRVDGNANAAGVQGFTFVGTNAFSNKAGELRYDVQNGQSFVFADVNGDGVADLSFQVNAPSLNASDFFGIAG